MILNSPYISGSLTVTGNITACGGVTISGSIASASYASNTTFLNGLGSEQFVPTGSFNTFSSSILTYTGSVNSRLGSLETASGSAITRLSALEVTSGSNITRLGALEVASGSAITRLGSIETVTGSNITRLSSLEARTGSYATTGSNTFVGGQTISGSVLQSGSFTTTGTIIAQTINVQTVTSSIVYSSGSNIFGNLLGDSQTFTGSVLITGSLTIAGASSASSYSGATIYGSTAVCSAVGKFTTCIDAGSGTFSSSVTATSFTVGNGQYFKATRNSGNTVIDLLGIESGTDNTRLQITNDFNIVNGSFVGQLKIASTGIACFACQVCVGGMIALTNQTFGTPASESAFRIRLSDNGGVNNDPGIGLDGSSGGGEKMWFNTLGGFYFNFGTNGSKINIDSAGITTFSSTVCVPTLESCGVINIQQRCFGGSAGLNIIGCNTTQNYPNMGFSMQNTCNLVSQGAIIEGCITSTTCGSESMGLDFFTKSSGTLSKKFTIHPAGVVCFVSTICAQSITFCSNINNGFTPIRICNPNGGSSAFSEIALFNDTATQAGLFFNSSTRTADGGVCSLSLYNDATAGSIRIRSVGCITLATGVGNINRFSINTNGLASFCCQVGIGTTPTFTFDVFGELGVYCTGGASEGGVSIQKDCAGRGGKIQSFGASSYLVFTTNLSGTNYDRLKITCTGVVHPMANGTQDFGTCSLRWGTIYTSDLSLSNGIGDYTIVEGEDDLFLYNNKQCKVYKFMLQQVCAECATPKKS